MTKLKKIFLCLVPCALCLTLAPQVSAATGCATIGANSAVPYYTSTLYDKAKLNKMGWTLEIATASNPDDTIKGIKTALANKQIPIVRIGVGNDSGGFTNPQDYIAYLNTVASQGPGSFYAIAGPNEPDAEHWLGSYDLGDEANKNSPETRDNMSIAGTLLANYMNTLIVANLDPKIKLLSPAINITSWSGIPLLKAMKTHGAKFSGLDALAVNSYTFSDSGRLLNHLRLVQEDPDLAPVLGRMKVVITEIGTTEPLGGTARNTAMTRLGEDVAKIKSGTQNIIGALIFNVFATGSSEWKPFSMSPQELALVIGPDCASVDTLPQKKSPLEEGFEPLEYDCGETTDPEYHPLRPYPGSPCDKLIPRSIPEAPKTLEKKYNTFACGNQLTPVKDEVFDPYGDNRGYGDSSNPLDWGLDIYNVLNGELNRKTYCDPQPDALNKTSGGKVTCYRSEYFDVTLDFSKANLGIISNTQDTSLTDAQKVNNYLSWYLNGSPQIGDHLPIDKNNPTDIDRVVNYSGPIRKLLPQELQDATRQTVADSANTIINPNGTVHNYLVGCSALINPNEYIQQITAILSDVSRTYIDVLTQNLTILASKNPAYIGPFFAAIPSTQSALRRSPPDLVQAANDYKNQVSLLLPGQSQAIADITEVFTKLLFNDFKLFLTYANVSPQIAAIPIAHVTNCADGGLSSAFKKRLADFNSVSQTFRNFLRFPSLQQNIVIGLQEILLQQLIQNLPLSSLEDIAGEVTLSVFRDPSADQQSNQVVPDGTNGTAPLELRIKKAETASP